jgi:hypothetical protein
VIKISEKILIALGGNAILKHTEEGTAEQQFKNIRKNCKSLRYIKPRAWYHSSGAIHPASQEGRLTFPPYP